MKDFFKPLSKRDAFIGTIIFSIVLLVMIVSLVRSFLAGETFDDVRNEILIVVMIAFIDYGMYTIYKSKVKEEKEAPKDPVEKLSESYADPDPDAPIELKDEAEVLAGKYEEPR